MIYRYPRYGELYDAWRAQRARSGASAVRCAGVSRPADVVAARVVRRGVPGARPGSSRDWSRRARDFSLADQAAWARSSGRSSARCCRTYQRLAAAGQIEISTTPFYHPILPLICDSDIAGVSHPGRAAAAAVSAIRRMRASNSSVRGTFIGACISESSPSGCGLRRARSRTRRSPSRRRLGFSGPPRTTASSTRTLGTRVGVEAIYRPYLWRSRAAQIGVIFRDHFLSDLIGFVYSKMDAEAAADDFLRRIRENCREHSALRPRRAGAHHSRRRERVGILRAQRAPVPARAVPAHIGGSADDGDDGQPRRCGACAPEPLDRIFPGSWINANFDVWIGAEEDNKAWAHLLRARQTFDAAPTVSEEQRAAGIRGTADRRGQRLVLVVRAGARFGQPRRVRPAVSQPPGQRLPRSWG